MTVQDAAAIGAMDAEEAVRRLVELRGPEEIRGIFLRFLLWRLDGMDDGSAETWARSKLRYPSSGRTPSARIVVEVEAFLRGLCGLLPGEPSPLPREDALAIVRWAGAFLPRFLGAVHDADTDLVLADIPGLVQRLERASDEADRALLTRIAPWVSPPGQRFLRGLVLEAKWALEDGDGESHRHRLVTARRTMLHLAARGYRTSKLFDEPVN